MHRGWSPGTTTILVPDTGPSTEDDSRESYIVLDAVRKELIPAIRLQYMQVASDPGARGKIVLRWSITPDGRASNVVVAENTTSSHELLQRIVSTVSHWRYPHVSRVVGVSFPFVFG